MKKKFQLIFVFVCSAICLPAQSTWSKIWDSGNTEITNRIKSSHLINDTLYYVTFNVCDFDGQSFNECNTIGMMDNGGNIIKDKLVEGLSILETGNIPWLVEQENIVLLDGKGTWQIPTMDIKIYNRFTLDSVATYTYTIRDSIDFNFGSSIQPFGDYYVASGWYRITGTDTWPDFLLWINKETMELDTIIEYPFAKESVIPEFLFSDKDSILSVYFSGIDINGTADSRGFMNFDSDKDITFFYLDTIDQTTRHSYPHTAIKKKDGNMVYKQTYNRLEQPWPRTWNSNFDILCIDEEGNIKWRFNKPGWSYTNTIELQFQGSKEIFNMSETADGDILACGRTNWHSNYPTIFEYNWLEDTLPPYPDSLETYIAPYILKLDGETGELIWQYSILEYDDHGNVGPYSMRQVHELSDGSIIGTGWAKTYDEDGKYLRDDSWAIRLPPDGCIEDGNMECGFENYVPTSTDDPILIDMREDKPFVFYPNPSDGLYTVEDRRSSNSKVSYEVFEVGGGVVTKGNNVFLTKIDLRDHSSNIFFIKIYDDNGKQIQAESLVKW